MILLRKSKGPNIVYIENSKQKLQKIKTMSMKEIENTKIPTEANATRSNVYANRGVIIDNFTSL